MIDKLTTNWVVIRAEFSHSTGTETRNLRCISEDVQTAPKMMRKRSFRVIKLPASIGWQKKQGNSRKTSTSASLTMLKPLTVWIMTNHGKFWEREIWDHLTCLLRNLYAGQEATVRTGHGTMDWFQTGKGVQGCILSPCLTSIQSTSCEMLGWMKHKLESRLLGEISITSDMLMTPTLW